MWSGAPTGLFRFEDEMKTREEFLAAVKRYQAKVLQVAIILLLLIGAQTIGPDVFQWISGKNPNPVAVRLAIVWWFTLFAAILTWCWWCRPAKIMRDCGVDCSACECSPSPMKLKAALAQNKCSKCGQPLYS
jgi:hypothetical protein